MEETMTAKMSTEMLIDKIRINTQHRNCTQAKIDDFHAKEVRMFSYYQNKKLNLLSQLKRLEEWKDATSESYKKSIVTRSMALAGYDSVIAAYKRELENRETI